MVCCHNLHKAASITAAATLLAVLLVIPAHAEPSGCVESARQWIHQLDDEKNADVYQRHTTWNCEFSGKWVAQSVDVTDRPRRERLCNDLVLIWTHKKCGYFRDVINPAAYEPCKDWSREMFRHCMANDADWFPATQTQVFQ